MRPSSLVGRCTASPHDTAREFQAVNGVVTHGGSIDAAGAIAVGDMLYAQSGYAQFGELPGNALLAFRVRE